MVAAFDSLGLDLACITETWFRPGKELNVRLSDIEGEHGIRIIHKSRDGRSKRTGGGVAVAFRTGRCNLRRRARKDEKTDHEILCVTGKVGKRKIAVFVTYVPPGTRAAKFRELCDTLVAEIAAVKTALGDPIIYVAGDFNHRDAGPCLDLAGGLKLIRTPPTGGDSTLDLVYTNAVGADAEVEIIPPLDTDAGRASDHKCVYVRHEFPSTRNFTWVAKFRRTRTKASEEALA